MVPKSYFFGGIFCLFFYLLLSPFPALADNWQAAIHENGAPQALVGVDKKKRTFNFFEKRSPMSLRYQYPCVTGQLSGDKYQINDLKTPEGIYFVEYKIANGLDFKEYGGIAYTLNYPNPVDKLRGKTGHGIWIHSKGFELVPTRGCVAIDLRDIAEIGPRLTPGLPVILAEELTGVTSFDNGAPAQLISLMNSWTNAWASKSPQLFDYYDAEAYSAATENFSRFRQNKERLFKMLSFIKIFNREIHALEGPGYWVTWAEQLYTASNLSTEGVRRLYWQKNDAGQFRIVGMEWIPKNLGMAAEYKKGKLVASISENTVSDAFSEAPKPPRLDMPEQAPVVNEPARTPPAPTPKPAAEPLAAKTSSTLGKAIRSLADKFVAISDPLIPGKQPSPQRPDEIEWGIGRKLAEPESGNGKAKSAPISGADGAMQPETLQKPAEVVREQQPPASKAADNANDRELIEARLKAFDEALKNRDPEILALYDKEQYNRMPASSGIPRTGSFNSLSQSWKREFSQPGYIAVTRPASVEMGDDLVKTRQDILLISSRSQRQGIQNLWWRKDAAGQYRIVGSQFQPQPLGLEANYLEVVSSDISSMIEDWRKAWENAHIDDYMSFYLPDANQQGRYGSNNIRNQKSGLWNRVRPVLVQLSGLRLTPEQGGIRADMTQSYADSAGRSDKGIKTLFLRYDGKNWRIKREDWADLKKANQD